MNSLPSHNNSANERSERRANWKNNMQGETLHEILAASVSSVFARHAQKSVAAGLVSSEGNQYFVRAGKRHYTVYKIGASFRCECKDQSTFGDCTHQHAARIFDGETENQSSR